MNSVVARAATPGHRLDILILDGRDYPAVGSSRVSR